MSPVLASVVVASHRGSAVSVGVMLDFEPVARLGPPTAIRVVVGHSVTGSGVSV